MDVLREKCAGLDVHRSVIVACVLVSTAGGRITKEVRSFAAIASGLAELAAWLSGFGVSHVGMEGTGVYWMPVYAALEAVGGITPIVANARHIKAVPGRKTDVIDAEWIAKLIRYGLVRASFVPPQAIRDLRDLTRYRRTLVDAQSSERRRLIKLLEAADMKLAEVLSDVFGVSGRAILRALIDGTSTPAQMAALAKGIARKKIAPLTAALGGQLAEHQRFMLQVQLRRIEDTEQQIARLDQQIEVRLRPYRDQIKLLISIPGIDRVGAVAILAEIGPDMSVFATPGHLAAWAGVCPGNNESAGKKKAAAARTGNRHLKTALCNAAIAASRKKGSYFKAKYYSLKSRIGGGKAALAIGHKLLTCIWHMLSDGCFYRDLGETYLDRRNQQQTLKRYARKLDALGFTIVPKQETVAMAA
ncbi:MAG: IS110 family transposase [Tepidisphaerales bacterium]